MNCILCRHFDQKDFKVVVDLEKLLFTAASGEDVSTLQPSITSLYSVDFDFVNLCAQLRMLPDIIKASGIQDKSRISVRFINEAMLSLFQKTSEVHLHLHLHLCI